MPLILDRTEADSCRIVGVVCSCCLREIRDDIELGEVIHIRLRAGYGSAWEDGNIVEVDLCDECGHSLLKPHANVFPSSELLRGQVVGGFRHSVMKLSAFASPSILFDGPAEGSPQLSNPRGAWAWVCFQVLRYFIPAWVLFRPIVDVAKSFSRAIEIEEFKLRLRFGRHE